MGSSDNVRVILSAPGSRGDVNPMIAIGSELRRRGHDCVISIAEPYQQLAESAGLQTEIIIDQAEFDQMIGDPKVWRPVSGAVRIFRAAADFFTPRHLDVIQRHHRVGDTVLVSHPLDFASRIYRDHDPATPLASIQLAPAMQRLSHRPPKLTPWWFEPRWPPALVRTLYAATDVVAVDRILSKSINGLRQELGLNPIRRFADKWWISPDHLVLMYPEWFCPEADRQQPPTTFAGFPLSDGPVSTSIDDTVAEAVKDRPVVFTAGTANSQAKAFFAAAAETCQQLNLPGLLLSAHAENIPTRLSTGVNARRYVSLREALPHCRAIVHHGGVGTTSQAFAAGIPQLIKPMAFDQFDNAERVQRLGCGRSIKRLSSLTGQLHRLIEDENHCASIRNKITQNSASAIAADAIEALMSAG